MNRSIPALPKAELSTDQLRQFVEAFFDAIENGEFEPNPFELNAIAASLDKTSTDITPPKQDDTHHELD